MDNFLKRQTRNYFSEIFKKKDLNIFALQNSSAMGAAAPWSSTMMMDRISLDDMPHKGRGNTLIKHELPHAVLRRPFDLSRNKNSMIPSVL